MEQAGVDSAWLFTPGDDCDFRARMFSPNAGIPEDPATGSATAVFAAQLRAARVLRQGTQSFLIRQGVEMGRASDIGLSIDLGPEGLTAIRIRGAAVPISSGRIRIPR
jgi:trans-2,3-dihydro-3-hydroxyanthranilate isomerase